MEVILIAALSLCLVVCIVALIFVSTGMRRQTKRDYDERLEKMRREFGSQQSSEFRESARSEISALLNPLRERISEFRDAMNINSRQSAASNASLATQIESLVKANHEIGIEARRLSNALKGDTRIQGAWGESVLSRIFEQAGLSEGIHFISQAASFDGKTIVSDEGDRYRPDYLLLIPGGHKVVIDAKTSLSDYLRYMETPDETEARQYLNRHSQSVRKHIRALADKQYHRHIDGALEHTLMFIPNDGSYIAAIRNDADLQEFAFRHNIVIVSPAHILSIVQLLSQLWRVERQNRHAEAIADAGGKLYDKFVLFLQEFEKIERNLQLSLKAYESAFRHLAGGRQSIVERTEKLRDLGAKVTRRIPEDILSRQSGSEEE